MSKLEYIYRFRLNVRIHDEHIVLFAVEENGYESIKKKYQKSRENPKKTQKFISLEYFCLLFYVLKKKKGKEFKITHMIDFVEFFFQIFTYSCCMASLRNVRHEHFFG